MNLHTEYYLDQNMRKRVMSFAILDCRYIFLNFLMNVRQYTDGKHHHER